ncbi:MAG: tail fiber domain-containing protein [Bacteriovorax sp.]|nr:tail fiber domain-containing protein [Bacteriovorax sp.]
MQDASNKKKSADSSNTEIAHPKKEYDFGGIQEFSLEKIEEGILEESIYLDVFAGSDIAFKDNIRPLENVLSSIANLNCITYDYNIEKYSNKDFPESRQLGVVAQEIQLVFPELVRNDKDGDLQVNYSQLSTIALQAVKELGSLLEKSNERISRLEKEIEKLKK